MIIICFISFLHFFEFLVFTSLPKTRRRDFCVLCLPLVFHWFLRAAASKERRKHYSRKWQKRAVYLVNIYWIIWYRLTPSICSSLCMHHDAFFFSQLCSVDEFPLFLHSTHLTQTENLISLPLQNLLQSTFIALLSTRKREERDRMQKNEDEKSAFAVVFASLHVYRSLIKKTEWDMRWEGGEGWRWNSRDNQFHSGASAIYLLLTLAYLLIVCLMCSACRIFSFQSFLLLLPFFLFHSFFCAIPTVVVVSFLSTTVSYIWRLFSIAS